MGQAPSQVDLETRVEDPPGGARPRGLALVAHGRLGGTMDQPPVRRLAEYLRDARRLRVVTWNARGVGASAGGNEWSSPAVWTGGPSVDDYNRLLRESMAKFLQDFPDASGADLFICGARAAPGGLQGYSAGAVFAGSARPAAELGARFAWPRYVLVSFPVDLLPAMALGLTGRYLRAVEALAQGHGWEGLPPEFAGSEPGVAGVLTNRRRVLRQVVVPATDHPWNGTAHRIVEEVDSWLAGT
ncbi:hypothetical protein GGS23DRAFT_596190 [Durotheca rogersii]|uniref:uncharacterized protein n=1 Tax=Durotheca rogersii TaxID=419775 RepID=UPI00221F5ED8|nr:uncharacterized protein GGS23DRAFT_596190 [Durotheca rogersii]KAI5863685.1 hypothetical protein GGS23DRAFT_596190 [Durotheca rogersii]